MTMPLQPVLASDAPPPGKPLTAFSRRGSLFTRRGLACLFIVSVLTAARGANTFVNTDALAATRTAQTTTLLPNGKVLVAGGQNAGNAITSAESYDPSTGAWTATGSLATARYYHTATMLPNGKVLVAGGFNASGAVASAELYDPAAGTWSATGALALARNGHTATLLASGKVLVAGGNNNGSSLASAELYDPVSGTWSATGPLAAARQSHTATLLPNGNVLVAAGAGVSFLASAELYDAGAGTWSGTGALATARYLHTATLLPSGKVLVAGGEDFGYLASAQLYDPATGNWTNTGAFTTARSRHTATLLPNGKVIIAGGFNGSGLTSAQIYDPTAGTWSATGALVTGRFNHTATMLPDGRMLVVGGGVTSTELFDSALGAWSATGALATVRQDHTATLLPNSRVLVAGGQNLSDGVAHTSAEIYDPATGAWDPAGPLAIGRFNHTATLLPNGKMLVVGGQNGPPASYQYFASAEIYDLATNAWSAAGSLSTARGQHTATLLLNGKVLVVGGQNIVGGSPQYLASAELYDPATGGWSPTGPLATGRSEHTATLLPNGKVLVVAGSNGVDLTSAELYDPANGTWSATGALDPAGPRLGHTATLLPDGKVLIAGGYSPSLGGPQGNARLYNPVAGIWSSTGPLGSGRSYHTATLLPNGRVLAVGGSNGNGGPPSNSLGNVTIYDPGTGVWTAAVSLITSRYKHTATLLPDGRVLVVGGWNSLAFSDLSDATLYDGGLGFSGASQPQIVSASFDAAGKLALSGAGFRGTSSASGGNGGQDSPTNYPVVQLRQLDNEQSAFLLPDPAATVSATGFTSVPVAPFSGFAHVRVFANGIPSPAFPITFPEISVEQPVGTGIAHGGTKSFETMFVGSPAVSLIFTIKNPNTFNLTGLTITKDGANAADFTVTANPTAPVPPGGSTTFTIQFASGTSGTKTAAIHIANNVAGKNPYDINLTGQAYSFTTDTDGDGMYDASEYQMATLGFDWQVSQPNLVNTYTSSANGAGYYSPSQLQALQIDTPLIFKDPGTGEFTLIFGLKKSADLLNYQPFPMTSPGTTLNGAGKIEFKFTMPDPAMFFRLETQ